jgi:hypothetical protein
MWELIANGLGLAGTGYALASGFSLDKRVEAIASSRQRLDNLQLQLLERAGSSENLIDRFLPLLRAFGQESNPREQLKTVQILAEYSRQLRADLKTSTSSLLQDVVSEMGRIIDSVRLTHSTEQRVPRKFLSDLYHEPFAAGVVEFQDVSEHGIWGVREPYIVGSRLSPLWWANPLTGQSFLGKISMAALQRYGIKTSAPKYLHITDGHVFSPEHGLYLPSYIVERFVS